MTIDRKNVVINSFETVLFPKADDQSTLQPNGAPSIHEQSAFLCQEIARYLSKENFDGKIILNLPSKFLTVRFFNFPTIQKRKIDLMVPFQLDKDLPYTLQEVQYSKQVILDRESSYAVCSVIEHKKFEQIHAQLERYPFPIAFLTGEINVYQIYLQQKKIDAPTCILNIGHETTTAYFTYHRKIVAYHISLIGGKNITENIAATYSLSQEDANEYKHKTAFFLTPKQMENVLPEQKEFAELMRNTFAPIIQDFERWAIGFKITYGQNIEKIFLTGGTSNIKNIENFLTESLKISIVPLNPEKTNNLDDDHFTDTKIKNIGATAYMMAQSLAFKDRPGDFRRGTYAKHTTLALPLHSTLFITSRILLASLFILIVFGFELLYIHTKEDKLNKNLANVLKAEEIALSNKDRNTIRHSPLTVLKKLEEREDSIRTTMKLIKEFSATNALDPLVYVSQGLKTSEHWDLKKFVQRSAQSTFIFNFNDDEGLRDMKRQVELLAKIKNQYQVSEIKENKSSKEVELILQDKNQ